MNGIPKAASEDVCPKPGSAKAKMKKNKVCLTELSAGLNGNQGVTQRLLGAIKKKKGGRAKKRGSLKRSLKEAWELATTEREKWEQSSIKMGFASAGCCPTCVTACVQDGVISLTEVVGIQRSWDPPWGFIHCSGKSSSLPCKLFNWGKQDRYSQSWSPHTSWRCF